MKPVDIPPSSLRVERPSVAAAEEAIRTLIRFMGDDPGRPGLIDTPSRVVKSYAEYFSGYHDSAETHLARTFDEVEGYQDFVLLQAIPFHSHCEHHLAPITGHVSVAYLPKERVVGISKLARLVDVFAKRLQIQERMTNQIALTLERALQPRGVAVFVDASHACMTARGVKVHGTMMKTSRLTGLFETDQVMRQRLFQAIS